MLGYVRTGDREFDFQAGERKGARWGDGWSEPERKSCSLAGPVRYLLKSFMSNPAWLPSIIQFFTSLNKT